MAITSGSIPEAMPGGTSSNEIDTMAAVRRRPVKVAYKQAAAQDMCAHQAPGVKLAHCHYTGRTEA
jgi:hypothetical protein